MKVRVTEEDGSLGVVSNDDGQPVAPCSQGVESQEWQVSQDKNISAFLNVSFVCALLPYMLIDFGFSPFNMYAVSVVMSAVLPVLVIRFVCKGTLKECLEGWLASVLSALLTGSLIVAFCETLIFKFLQNLQQPVVSIFILITAIVSLTLPWAVRRLWECFRF